MRPRSNNQTAPKKKAVNVPEKDIKPGKAMYVLRKDHAKKVKIT